MSGAAPSRVGYKDSTGSCLGARVSAAAEFSFLLGLITLSAASGYKALSVGPEILSELPVGPALAGILVATVSAMLAVKWLVGFLNRRGLTPFAIYRVILAIAVLVYFGIG